MKQSYAMSSCGLCCHKPSLCDSCLKSTLGNNGLRHISIEEIRGLSFRWSGDGGFQYSDLYYKLKKLSGV